jgi:nicotinamidase
LKWQAIIATKDWHPSSHISFASLHGKRPFDEIILAEPAGGKRTMNHVLWPDHCVQDSKGSEFPHDFLSAKADKVIKKGYLEDREYYSAFQDVWGLHKTELDNYLAERSINQVFVVGLALDYCVFNTAKDAAALGYDTYVILDGCRAVDVKNNSNTIDSLKSKGVKVITSDFRELENLR